MKKTVSKRIIALALTGLVCCRLPQVVLAEDDFASGTQGVAAQVQQEEQAGEVQGLPDYGLYEISSALDKNFCLDIAGASQADKANLQLYESNGTNAQKFWLKPIEGEEGLYTIINASSAKVLDVNANSKENGANVQQYTSNGTTAQMFRLIANPDGSYRIQGVGSERYVSVAGESAGNSVNIHMFRDDTVEAKAEAVEPEEAAASAEPEKDAETAVPEENTETVEPEADTELSSEEENSEPAEIDENTLTTQSAGDIEGTEEAEDIPAGEMADGEGPAQSSTDILTTAGTDEESTPQEEGDELAEEEETVPANQCWIITETKYQMPAEGLYEVTSALNQNYCLDVNAASLANSANIQLYSRNGTNAQKFYVKYFNKDKDLVTLTNAGSAKVIDVAGNGKANGTNILQYTPNGTSAQIFRLVPSENGGIMLEGQGSGNYVDVNSARVANGTNIWLYEGNNTAAQRWYFKATGYKFPSVARGKSVASTPVSGYVTIVPKGNTSLSVQPSSEANQSGIVLGKITNSTKDKWTMRELGGGRYEFINVATGCALDDKYASMADANQMWLYGINGTASQSWMPEDTGDGDGSFYLKCRQSGKYLDIRAANLKAGSVVQQYTGNKTIAQKFYLRTAPGVSNGWHKVNGVDSQFSGGRIVATRTPEQAAMMQKANSFTSATSWLMLVNLTTRRVGIFRGSRGNWNMEKYYLCSPGAPATPTVEGTFTVQGKQLYFGSSTYRCWYATQFYGDYLFHSVTYYPDSGPYVIQEGKLGVYISHGCVRLALENAKWIYDHVPSGTKVFIYH